jgi:hypothetical protein
MNRDAFQLPKQFMLKFPDMKQEIAQKHFNKYLDIMRNELLYQLPKFNDDIDIVNINLNRLWSYRFNYKNTQYYIWKEFKDLLPFVYISDLATGSNLTGRISKGMITNQKYIDLLIDTADTKQLVDMFYGSYQINDMNMIPIDMKSTRGYIANTEHKLNTSDTNIQHRKKMIANLRQAKYIKLIAEYYYPKYGMYVLPHIPSKSEYGRTYYKGLNLQNCSKEVRAATLGTHYQYDMYAMVFAIKLYLADEILKKQGNSVWREFSYTTDYLENKDMIRKQLAKHIQAYPDGIKLVKQAITSIGFGSRISDGSWLEGLTWQTTSIKDIIKNRHDLQRFINDDWVKNFHNEQKQLTKLIVDDYLKNQGFVETIQNLRDIKSNNGNWSKQRIMSYIFQNIESHIINTITEDLNIIIKIHDAFLMKNKIPTEKLLDIKTTLNKTSEFFKLEMAEVEGWNSFDSVLLELEHQAFIEEQERYANLYKSKFVQTDNIPVRKPYIEYMDNMNDSKCYDSYDDGRKHEEYHVNSDEYLNDMTLQERNEHFRIVGYEVNSLPNFIKKLI